MEFYASVEQAITRRQIPNCHLSRVEFKEGIGSARREYLRALRGEHVVDIGAAPFGTGFFFSSWLAGTPALSALKKLGIVLGLWIAAGYLVYTFGVLTGLALSVAGLFLLLFVASQLGEWDTTILEIPGIGWIYGRFFSPPTYYRMDTALMFQESVHNAVLEVVDCITAAKGIRALTEAERKPILKAFAASA